MSYVSRTRTYMSVLSGWQRQMSEHWGPYSSGRWHARCSHSGPSHRGSPNAHQKVFLTVLGIRDILLRIPILTSD
jgi:hypothetical protein